MTPAFVAAVTGGRVGPRARPAQDLIWDSRQVEPGTLFVALPGRQTHGNRYLDEALRRGATLLLTDEARPEAVHVRDPWSALIRLGRALRDALAGPVVGVTGSVGKTTTKEALAQGLGLAAPPGNLNTAPALARFFLHAPREGSGAVVELGIDRPGEMAELLDLAAPEVGVLTAIAPAHLEALKDEAQVAREKRRLLEASPLALVEAEAAARWGLPGHRYGFSSSAVFRGEGLELTAEGVRFHYRGRRVFLPYPHPGVALAALAALALAELWGRPLSEVTDRLADLRLPPGRMERRTLGPYRVVHDAYNANPASTLAGLNALTALPGPRVVVLGSMHELGPRAVEYHRQVARAAARVADKLLFVGPFAQAMRDAAGRGETATDLETAKAALTGLIEPGDLLYLKASRAEALERLLEVLDG